MCKGVNKLPFYLDCSCMYFKHNNDQKCIIEKGCCMIALGIRIIRACKILGFHFIFEEGVHAWGKCFKE